VLSPAFVLLLHFVLHESIIFCPSILCCFVFVFCLLAPLLGSTTVHVHMYVLYVRT
jgi:hypothetical protein